MEMKDYTKEDARKYLKEFDPIKDHEELNSILSSYSFNSSNIMPSDIVSMFSTLTEEIHRLRSRVFRLETLLRED